MLFTFKLFDTEICYQIIKNEIAFIHHKFYHFFILNHLHLHGSRKTIYCLMIKYFVFTYIIQLIQLI